MQQARPHWNIVNNERYVNTFVVFYQYGETNSMKTVKFLNDTKQQYVVHNINKNPSKAIRELKSFKLINSNVGVVPIVFYNKSYVGGYNEVVAAIKNNGTVNPTTLAPAPTKIVSSMTPIKQIVPIKPPVVPLITTSSMTPLKQSPNPVIATPQGSLNKISLMLAKNPAVQKLNPVLKAAFAAPTVSHAIISNATPISTSVLSGLSSKIMTNSF